MRVRANIAALVALALLLPWGIPGLFIGIPQHISVQVQQLSIALGFLIVFVVWLRRPKFYGAVMVLPLVFFCYVVIVSFLYSNYIVYQPARAWLPGVITLAPALLIPCLIALRATDSEVLVGLVGSVVCAALLVIIDRFVQIDSLSTLTHRSTVLNASRRIVLMHNETVICAGVLLAVCLCSALQRSTRLLSATGLFALVYIMLFVHETRLTIASFIIGSTIYITAFWKNDLKFLILPASLFVMSFLFYVFAGVYLQHFFSVFSFLEGDHSASFRLVQLSHFRYYFEETGGLGFGVMSSSPNVSNVISDGLYRWSEHYGAPDYFLSLVDIRIFGAFFQYGYFGGIGVLLMTNLIVYFLISSSRDLSFSPQLRAIRVCLGCMVFAFMLSPLPQNFFGDRTMTLGFLLMYIALPKPYPSKL